MMARPLRNETGRGYVQQFEDLVSRGLWHAAAGFFVDVLCIADVALESTRDVISTPALQASLDLRNYDAIEKDIREIWESAERLAAAANDDCPEFTYALHQMRDEVLTRCTTGVSSDILDCNLVLPDYAERWRSVFVSVFGGADLGEEKLAEVLRGAQSIRQDP